MARTMTVDHHDALREFIGSLMEFVDHRTETEVIRVSMR